MPGPAPEPVRPGGAAHENAACERCHTQIAREWRSSMHAQADTDPVYRRALAVEPLPFCRGCHAPEANPRADAPPAVSAIGVGCVTCHVTTAGAAPDIAPTLATPASSGSTESPAPHAVLRAPTFATAAACAACHEFDFPTHERGQPSERMQSTVSEHAASPHADTSCAACHMPEEGGHRSHAFAASHDVAMLRSALVVTAARASASTVTVTLTRGNVGHAFPTGDLFRRLVVSAEAVEDDWVVVGEATRALHRRFELRETTPGSLRRIRHLVDDDRVGAGVRAAVPVSLDLGERAVGRRVLWRVEYQRVEHPIGSEDVRAAVADSIVVAEGTLL